MKLNQNKTIIAAVLAIAGGVASAAAADCDSVAEKTTAAIKKNPSEMLVVVSDMISKNDGCACEVVKAAIESAGGDKDQVRQIVVAAVSASATKAHVITECALAAAPGAAAEIRAGLGEVFEGGEAYSAKGKQVMVEETEDFGPDPVAVSGVYLIAPIAPTASALGVDQGLSDAEIKRLKRLERLTRDLEERLKDRPRPGGGGDSGGGQTPMN